jgi:hypothetical protein
MLLVLLLCIFYLILIGVHLSVYFDIYVGLYFGTYFSIYFSLVFGVFFVILEGNNFRRALSHRFHSLSLSRLLWFVLMPSVHVGNNKATTYFLLGDDSSSAKFALKREHCTAYVKWTVLDVEYRLEL